MYEMGKRYLHAGTPGNRQGVLNDRKVIIRTIYSSEYDLKAHWVYGHELPTCTK